MSRFASEAGRSIDRDRIIDGHLVPDEYFCPICQCLLWEPLSCPTCQHVFCQECLRKWLEHNQTNANTCPYRCPTAAQHPCPPYLQSLLSQSKIRCRNSSFGCTEVLPYEQLEAHENIHCAYASRTCSECEQLVLVWQLDEHEQQPGLCIPAPILCTICDEYSDASLFREHFQQCCESRISQIAQFATMNRLNQALLTGVYLTPNPTETFLQNNNMLTSLYAEQRQRSRLPTSLKGVKTINRAREENCGHFHHIWLMFRFILSNWRKSPFFLYILTLAGFFIIGAVTVAGCVLFCHWAYAHNRYGPLTIVFVSNLLCYGTSLYLRTIPDAISVGCLVGLCLLLGCTSRASLEYMEMDALFNNPARSIALSGAGLLVTKIILLLIRFYYWSMPTYAAECLFTLFNLFFGYKMYVAHANALATTARN